MDAAYATYATHVMLTSGGNHGDTNRLRSFIACMSHALVYRSPCASGTRHFLRTHVSLSVRVCALCPLLTEQPTNHLDVDATDWLEKLLADRSLTFVCVTHDRYFLENVCQEIIELDAAKLYR